MYRSLFILYVSTFYVYVSQPDIPAISHLSVLLLCYCFSPILTFTLQCQALANSLSTRNLLRIAKRLSQFPEEPLYDVVHNACMSRSVTLYYSPNLIPSNDSWLLLLIVIADCYYWLLLLIGYYWLLLLIVITDWLLLIAITDCLLLIGYCWFDVTWC